MIHVLSIGKRKLLFTPDSGLGYRPKRNMIGRGGDDEDYTVSRTSAMPEEHQAVYIPVLTPEQAERASRGEEVTPIDFINPEEEAQELERINKEGKEAVKKATRNHNMIKEEFLRYEQEYNKKEKILLDILKKEPNNKIFLGQLEKLEKEFNNKLETAKLGQSILKKNIDKVKDEYGKLYQETKKKFEKGKQEIQNKQAREALKQSEAIMKQIKEDEALIKKKEEQPKKTLMSVVKAKKEPKPKAPKEPKEKKEDKDYYYKEMLKFRPASLSSSLIISKGREKMEEDWQKLLSELRETEPHIAKIYEKLTYPGHDMLKDLIRAKEPIKPPELKTITSADAFEDAFKSETLMRRFLKQSKLRGLTDSQIDRAQLKIIETGTNYPQYGYTKDKNFPIDILVDVILDGVTIKKFAIELKYYDKTNMWTGLNISKSKPSESGQKMSFTELLEIQNTFFNDYKATLINKIQTLKDDIQEDELLGSDTTELEAKKDALETILSSRELCTKSFNDNVYGVYVGMKVTKTGYRFSEVTEEMKGINTLEFYQNLKKYQNVKSPRLILNHDGIIEDVWKPRKNERTEHYYNLLGDRELLFCVSFKDACIICDYSKKIREGYFDPLNVFKNVRITKSMYGSAHADSMAIPLEYFILFH